MVYFATSGPHMRVALFIGNRYLSRIQSNPMRLILACCCLCISIVCNAGVFDTLGVMPAGERISKAQDLYAKQIRLRDSVFAINELEGLVSLANSINDKALQCFSVSLLADQYARYRGLNPLSEKLHHEAVSLAGEYRLPVMQGICNYRMGRYFYSFRQYPVAFEYLLRADNILHEVHYRNVPDIDEILFFTGSIYYETGDYDKADSFLLQVQELPKVNDYIRKQSLNTLALIRKRRHDGEGALKYFTKTLYESTRQHDSAWIGISYGNMGETYFTGGRFKEAYPLLQAGANLDRHHKQYGDACINLLFLAQIDIAEGRTAVAAKRIDSAAIVYPVYSTLSSRRLLYETLAAWYERQGQTVAAISVQKRLLRLKDTIDANIDDQAFRRIQVQLETEKHLADIDRLEARASASAAQRNAIIALLALVVVVLLLLYNRYRLKARNSAEQLTNARRELQAFTENSRRKNELIEQFAAELERLKASMAGQPSYNERMDHFDRLVHSTILTDAEWADFRVLFDKVHKGFFARLEQKLPGLTLNETRLLALVKLGLGDADISNMLGITIAAVERSRQRLREKIHPSKDGLSLNDLVQAV